jgi:hypothetical protein
MRDISWGIFAGKCDAYESGQKSVSSHQKTGKLNIYKQCIVEISLLIFILIPKFFWLLY